MTHKPLLMFVALLAWGAINSSWAAAPEIAVIPAKQPPVIDGRLDDACWRGEPQIRDFRMLAEGEVKQTTPSQRTEAWLAADEDALYVAVKGWDDRIDAIKAVENGHDARVWRDDCIELFLMAGDAPPYYHFIANLADGRYDARRGETAGKYKEAPASWDGIWTAASRREKDHWIMEGAFPFAGLELGAARLAQGLRFNIGRTLPRLMEVACWPASGFHKYNEYTRLQGLRLDPHRYGLVLRGVTMGEGVAGMNRFSATVAEDPAAGPLRLQAKVRPLPEGAKQTFPAQVVSAPGAQVTLDYRIPLSGGQMSIGIECQNMEGKVRTCYATILRVPDLIDAALVLPLLYRSDAVVQLSGRVAVSAAQRKDAHLRIAVVAGEKILSNADVAIALTDGRFHGELPVGALAPGRYAVEVILNAPDLTTETVKRRFPFELLAGPFDNVGRDARIEGEKQRGE